MSLNLRWITHPSDWFLGATSSRMDWQAHGNEVWKVFGPGHTRKRHGGGKNSCSSVKAHQSWARPEQIHTIKYDFTIKTARFKCWYDQAFRYGRREGLWHTRGKTNTHTSLCESEGRSHCGCIKAPELATVIPARLLNQCFFFHVLHVLFPCICVHESVHEHAMTLLTSQRLRQLTLYWTGFQWKIFTSSAKRSLQLWKK